MVFSSSFFMFFFLPLCMILYFNPFFKSIKIKNFILLIFSLLFYCYGSLKYLWVLLLSIIFNYIIGIILEKYKYKKFTLVFGISLNVFLLLYFKIMGLVNTSTDTILPVLGPLGIAFFTFQEISYIIDIYRKVVSAEKNIIRYALYVSFFPQLISGPIIRYDEVYKELENRKIDEEKMAYGIYEFIIGLFKKCVLADTIGNCAITIFGFGSTSICYSWLGAISLMLQIYYDFSGYSNMAIGMAKIFGFNIKKNFDHPYMARSVHEYWKRWNISLGEWFNDYVLYPVCNSKIYNYLLRKISVVFNKKTAFKIMNYISLTIVWILVGLWHGLGINYLYMGIYYAFFLIIEKEFRFPKKKNILSNFYTLFVVSIATVLFFSYNDKEFVFLKSMFINQKLIDNRVYLMLSNYWIYYLVAIIFSYPVLDKIKERMKNIRFYFVMKFIFILIIFIISIYFIVVNEYKPFIYFNF